MWVGGCLLGHSQVCVGGWTLAWILMGVCGWGKLTWTLMGVCVWVDACLDTQRCVCMWVDTHLDTHRCVCRGDAGVLVCVCLCVCVWWGRSCAGLDVARWEEERPRGSEPQGSRRRGSGKERVKVGEEPGATPAGAQDRFRARGGPPCPCPHHLPVPQLPLVLTCVSVLCSFPCTC